MATQTPRVVWYTPLKWILIAIAVVLFLLSAFGVSLGAVEMTDLGLAFGFAAFLVPGP
jgi:hypothetical protein